MWQLVTILMGPHIVGDRATDSLVGVKKDLLGTTPARPIQLLDDIVTLTNFLVGVVGKGEERVKIDTQAFTV